MGDAVERTGAVRVQQPREGVRAASSARRHAGAHQGARGEYRCICIWHMHNGIWQIHMHTQVPIKVLEVTLDTRGWGEGFWCEIDAINLQGTALDTSTRAAAGPNGPAAGMAAGSAAGSRVQGPAWLPSMPWESHRAYGARVAYEADHSGATPPADAAEGMRRAALSMVYANATVLGCTYPSAVEASLGVTVHHLQPTGGGRGSGLAAEGEMRTEAAQRAV